MADVHELTTDIESSFYGGIKSPARRFEVAQRLMAELTTVTQLDPYELDSLEPVTLFSFDIGLGPEAQLLPQYSGRTLDQRLDIAFAEACCVTDSYRELRAIHG